MAHLPFGYKLEQGMIVLDEEKAESVRQLFQFYLSGKGLKESATLSNINVHHGSAGKMLQNEKYLGTDLLPPIIEESTFEAAQTERVKRVEKLGRSNKLKPEKVVEPATNFKLGKVRKFLPDPFKQAEYIYSLIESEVNESER